VGLGVGFAVMSKKGTLFSVVGGLAALVVGFVLFAYYDFTHHFRLSFTPQQVADAQTALKGAMGEAIFSAPQLKAEAVPTAQPEGKSGLDALFASAPPANKGQGLIEAYQKDPEKFKRYAAMLDTAMNAKQVGDVVSRQDSSHLPRTSEALTMAENVKVDAWGNPFCIVPAGEKLAIVSGGPSRISCDALPLTAEQITKSSRNIYAGPSDVVVLIAMRVRRPRPDHGD
jgi:hypothetical protein